jgi:hypothetical protein
MWAVMSALGFTTGLLLLLKALMHLRALTVSGMVHYA